VRCGLISSAHQSVVYRDWLSLSVTSAANVRSVPKNWDWSVVNISAPIKAIRNFFVVALSSKRQMLQLYIKLATIYSLHNSLLFINIIKFFSVFIWDTDIVVRHSIKPYIQNYGWTLCLTVQVCQQLLTTVNTVLSVFCRYHWRIVYIISLSRLVPPCGTKLT